MHCSTTLEGAHVSVTDVCAGCCRSCCAPTAALTPVPPLVPGPLVPPPLQRTGTFCYYLLHLNSEGSLHCILGGVCSAR